MRRTQVPIPEGRDERAVDLAATAVPINAPRVRRTSVREERWRAQRVMREAVTTMGRIIDRVREGQRIDPAPLNEVADRLLASVERNPDALRSLVQIRRADLYTFEHSVSVSVLVSSFGLAMELPREQLHQLAMAGLLHDVGKALTPRAILNKTTELTADEWEVIRLHAIDTRVLLERAGMDPVIVRAAAEHHERYDGSGYPKGLSGNAISLFGQMIGIADVYDAVTGDRVYRRGQTPTAVLRTLLNAGDKDFESSLVRRFIHTMGVFPVGTLVRLESGRLAVVLERGERELLRPLVRVFYDIATRRHLAPVDLDLTAAPTQDAIAAAELPARWDVKPHLYMD